MPIRTALLWSLCIFLGPIVLSTIFRYLVGYSIGPVVFAYSVLGAIALGAVSGAVVRKKAGIIVAVPTGVVVGASLGIVLINYFMLVTFLFGVKDYAPF